MEKTTLRKWNDLTEEVTAPPAVIAALMTSRPEMLMMAEATESTAEETAAFYNVIRVLMETNAALQAHSQRLATETRQLSQTLRGFTRKLDALHQIANFIEGDGNEEEI